MNKPILVTGSHRSGTTWIGKMICLAPKVGYIHEPFHCGSKYGINAKYWFTYITQENESLYYKNIRGILNFNYDMFKMIKRIDSLKDIKSIIASQIRYSYYRYRNARPLMKDPLAIFSAEWLAEKFDMDVVVMIRHPAAFVSSIKKLNWTHSFALFLEQQMLMKNHLYHFESEIEDCVKKQPDIIDQGILLWRIIYFMVNKYRKTHKDWIFVRHEDIPRDPLVNLKYFLTA